MKKLSAADMPTEDICARIKRLRISLGYRTAKDLAADLEISYSTYAPYEKSRVPSREFLHLLKKRFPAQVDIQWILSGDKAEAGEPSPSTGEHQREEPMRYGLAVELLRKIYDSGDHVLIEAIQSNLAAFSQSAEQVRKESALQRRIDDLERDMQAVLNKLETKATNENLSKI